MLKAKRQRNLVYLAIFGLYFPVGKKAGFLSELLRLLGGEKPGQLIFGAALLYIGMALQIVL